MRSRTRRALVLALVAAAVALAAQSGTAAPSGGAGSLLAFGFNYYGQLGNDTNVTTSTGVPTPAALTLPGETGQVAEMATAQGASLVVTSSGQLYAFGSNNWGQLGIGTNSGTSNPNASPTLVTLPGQVGQITHVSAGDSQSLVTTSSGQLYAFGWNYYGQLGIATNSGQLLPNPTPTPVGLPGAIGGVTQIAAGASHSLVVTSSGQLFTFGYNQQGQLGRLSNVNTATANPTPALVTLPGAVGGPVKIAGGGFHSLVLTASGQLYAFGENNAGQLGNTSNNGNTNANPTPVLVVLPGATGQVTQISAGESHSLVLTSTDQLYAFGDNTYGELGDPATSGIGAVPTPTLITLPGKTGRITQIAAGALFSLVVTSSGQLYGFGVNVYGELGSTANIGITAANPTPALVTLPAGTTIDTVAKGPEAYHALALVSDLAITSGTPAAAQVGIAYQAALTASGGAAPLTWSATGLPPGLALDSATGTVAGIPSAPGSFSPTITLTDSYGSSVSQTLALLVAAPPVTPPPIVKAPRLSGFKQSGSKWLLGTRLASLNGTVKLTKKAGLPVGTTFTFTLDKASRVTLVFRHLARGRRVGGTCVAETNGNARKPACTRLSSDGTLRVQARKGANRLHFEGRISRTLKLKSGVHIATITASAAGRSSAAKTLRFTIAAG